jgi:hypothetical protein
MATQGCSPGGVAAACCVPRRVPSWPPFDGLAPSQPVGGHFSSATMRSLHDGRVLHAVTLILEDIEGSGGRVFHPATTISDPLTWRSEGSQCGEGAEWLLQASVFRGKRSGATFADAPIGGHVVLSRDS